MDGDQEFPIPCKKFVETLKGSRDEVWSRWLLQQHGRESHLVSEWRMILEQHRHRPAYPKR